MLRDFRRFMSRILSLVIVPKLHVRRLFFYKVHKYTYRILIMVRLCHTLLTRHHANLMILLISRRICLKIYVFFSFDLRLPKYPTSST